MAGNILGEPGNFSQNGFSGVNLSTGAAVVYRNPRRGGSVTDTGDETARLAARYPKPEAGPLRDTGNATQGAEAPVAPSTEVEVKKVNSDNSTVDVSDQDELRTILKVPAEYIKGDFAAIFAGFGGVLFPYTPQITLESKAEYSPSGPLHSNYSINFYKNSSVSDISITSIFTVQNAEDAYYYIGAIRILTALTKMKFGNDSRAGSPPPICRLSSYGEWVLKNVPVVITSVKHDLPDDVDFYTTMIRGQRISVPTKATITVSCRPTYSRREMAVATVDSYISSSLIGKGYL